MDILNLYALIAFLLICGVFYIVRKIPFYVTGCALIIAVFLWRSYLVVQRAQLAEWLLAGLALILCSFGLLIVRVMLIRSVSLQLLARLAGGESAAGVSQDIGGRLRDMEYFHLIRRGENNALTGFGWFCSTVVVIFYTIFRIK